MKESDLSEFVKDLHKPYELSPEDLNISTLEKIAPGRVCFTFGDQKKYWKTTKRFIAVGRDGVMESDDGEKNWTLCEEVKDEVKGN